MPDNNNSTGFQQYNKDLDNENRRNYGNDGQNGGGSGSGYGYGSSSPSQAQKDAAAALAPIVAYGHETIKNKANQMGDVYDIADKGNQAITNMQLKQAEKEAGAEWFSRLLKEQSSYKHQRDVMGNTRYGTGALDLNTDFQRAHDANAVEVLEALEGNLSDIDVDALTALQTNINARNEMGANTEAALRQNASDYAAQLNNIAPELANGSEEGFDQIIDTENRTLNLPEWLDTRWYEAHKSQPVEEKYRGLTRPAAATERAYGTPNDTGDPWVKALQALHPNNGMAANKRYWDTLTRDYGHRVV